jgi:tetratricopeptide (TPR) repeat protein
MRIPRPDLTLRIGTPNACSGCHDDQKIEWAQQAVEKWYGTETSKKNHYGIAIHAGREGAVGALDLLTRLAEDETQVIVARATATQLLSAYPSQKRDLTLTGLLRSEDPLLRRAAIDGLENAPMQTRLLALPDLLEDPILDVRLGAYLNLSYIPAKQIPGRIAKRMQKVHTEYLAFFESRADRADAWFGLANLHLVQRRLTEAESAFLQSLALDPGFVVARANLADLYRQTKRELECDRILRAGLVPRIDTAPLYHALGLSLIRRKKYAEALQELGQAARLRPDLPNFVYAYALTLQGTGQAPKAIEVLGEARKRFPNNQQILMGLVASHETLGQRSQALGVAQELQALYPRDPEIRKLVQRLLAGK